MYIFMFFTFTLRYVISFRLITDKHLTKISKGNDKNLTQLISNIFEKYMESYRCALVVMDDFYYETIQSDFFKKLQQRVSMITIKVDDYEDLFDPCNETLSSLQLGKTTGCQFYLILILDTIQVTNLLKFGDSRRIINTRANFIINYDNQLFYEDMKYIWKRIVNVIFIREYGGIKRMGSKRKRIPWFEITTVPFPAPIGNSLVPRRLDIWRDGKFRSGIDLFRDKTNNLNKQKLQVVTFDHMPAVIKVPSGKGVFSTKLSSTVSSDNFEFAGIEMKILEIVSKAMNFEPELHEPDITNEYKLGEKQSDGKYNGLLGEMVASQADLALGDLHYSPQFLDLMDLSVPYNTECLAFLTPESLTNNSWKTLLLPFAPTLWAAIFICLFFIGFVFYVLSRYHNKVNEMIFGVKKDRKMLFRNVLGISKDTNGKLDVNAKYALMKKQYYVEQKEIEPVGLYLFGDIPNSILYTYGMLLVVSLPKLPTGWSLRVLTGWYWLYCILVVVAYRASMTAILAKPAPRVTIDTLTQLVDSGLPTGGWGEVNKNFFATSLDPLTKYVGDQFETIQNLEETIERIVQGKFAFYENVHFLKQAAVKRQLRFQNNRTKTGNATIHKEDLERMGNKRDEYRINTKHNLHIMSDCIIHMPISLGLQKNSPIKPRVDEYVKRAFEAGLIKKWLDDVMAPYITAELHFQEKGDVKALMNLEKFFGAIVALFVGLSISIFLLITEIAYFTFVTKKNPNYDKYLRIVVIK
ncbi:glutamate receptor ionotropic, kainate 1 [Agrilus planipennis]|uniref:Glutamate receptor ionotropic, kainate 1 n=1 Tax=Agrilus planipennis TaxID=224129 RepID=A0A1W4XI02_AGRPL|nr:glutamate receptor ionotropic, kainate 1 [Agrilus planipennis]